MAKPSALVRWSLCLVAALLVATALLAAAGAARAAEVQIAARHGQSVRGAIDGLPLVVLRGTLEERGEAFGALCGKDCVEMLATVVLPAIQSEKQFTWQTLTAMAGALFEFPAADRQTATAFIRGFRKTADPADRAIAPLGRELAEADLLTLQCFLDIAGSGRTGVGGCSSFSAWGELTADGAVITGRNLDYRTFPGRFALMVIAQQPTDDDRLATIDFSAAGILGASTGMNAEGVLLSLHDERGLPPSRSKGFCPRIAAVRQALDAARAATAVDDVGRVLGRTPPLMGGAVHVSMPLVAGKDVPRPAVVEWDANAQTDGVTLRPSDGDLEACGLVCTNHFLKRRAAPANASGNSQQRFRRLAEALTAARAAKAPIDLEKAKAMLGSVARSGGMTTYLSVIAFPAQRRMTVAVLPGPGVPATKGRWVDVEWEQVFGAK